MYKAFFRLTRNPFEISPDPYFLFATARHNEALASIVHGVLRHKGFIVVTGEVGTGKTLLVRCLLELLRRQDIASANVFNPCLSPLEFLRYIVGDLGIKATNQDKGSILLELNNYLIARHRNHTTTVLIVDEAQHLEPELLEEIRLLTNLETSQQKLLQIVLVGQPELDQKMDSLDLRQLKQRVAMRCQLEPLQEEETKSYILRRLQRAGANSHATIMFPEETIASVYRYSRGIPRLINTVCENALIATYAEKALSVRPEVIDEVAKDLRLNVLSRAAVVSTSGMGSQHDVAKSLLELVTALERVARNTAVTETSFDHGVKTV
jgi:type II secretory pathway predicted ATPase ExeA